MHCNSIEIHLLATKNKLSPILSYSKYILLKNNYRNLIAITNTRKPPSDNSDIYILSYSIHYVKAISLMSYNTHFGMPTNSENQYKNFLICRDS